MIKMIKPTKKQFIKDYEILREKAIRENITNLNKLTDYELFLFITAKTINFGRTFNDSVTNALIHLENRENTIKLFNTEENDLMGCSI